MKSIRVQMGKGPGAHKFAFVDFYDTDSTQRALNRHEALFFGMTLNVSITSRDSDNLRAEEGCCNR